MLICLANASVLAYERQFYISTYFDSNPREHIEDKEPTYGLKSRALMRFDKKYLKGRYYGSILGQGFLEPELFLNSKVIFNGDLGGHYNLVRGYALKANFHTFQKLYFDDLQRSGRTSLSFSVKRMKTLKTLQEIGLQRTASFIDFGSLFHYTEIRGFLRHAVNFHDDFQAEFTAQLGQIRYRDYLARIRVNESSVKVGSEDQQNFNRRVGLHVNHRGKMIWGMSIDFEDIQSNSATAESRIWMGKAYVSGRLSDELFYHLVLKGMKKYYAHPEILQTTPYRDPEENIQNQLHVQIERVLTASRVLYVQYSFIKNETVFNHWFYNKNLIEAGIKVSL